MNERQIDRLYEVLGYLVAVKSGHEDKYPIPIEKLERNMRTVLNYQKTGRKKK